MLLASLSPISFVRRVPLPLQIALIALLACFPAPTRAQSFDSVGRWAEHLDWQTEQIHMAMMPGDPGGAPIHSKILTWRGAARPLDGNFWGWSPRTADSTKDCSVFGISCFTALPLDSLPVGAHDLFCSGHSMLADGTLLISGGHGHTNNVGIRQSVIFRPNQPAGQQWSMQADMDEERWYPTNTTLPDGKVMTFSGARFKHMVVFGGTSAPLSDVSTTNDDINRMGFTHDCHWQPAITASGDWPDPREGHSAVWRPASQEMIVFGGRTTGGGRLNNIWALKVDKTPSKYTYFWSRILPVEPPPLLRARHSAVMRNDGQMLVYGGSDGSNQPVQDYLWELWRDGGGFSHWRNRTAEQSGPLPGARYGHAVTTLPSETTMLMFGGRASSGFADDKIYLLSLNSMVWSQISPTTRPDPRDGHSMVLDPLPRKGPFSQSDRRVVLFGGETAGGRQSDVWTLWIGPGQNDYQWRQQTVVGTGPTPRKRHSSLWDKTDPTVPVYDRMVMFGGDTGASGSSSEAWALTLTDSVLSDLPDTVQWVPLLGAPSGLAGQTAIGLDRVISALDPERFSPSAGTWTLQNAPKLQEYYPFTFVLPSGNLFYAGPSDTTFVFNRSTSQAVLEAVPPTPSGFRGGTAVMFRPGEIMKCGSVPYGIETIAVGTAKKIKLDSYDIPTTSAWVSSNDMIPRFYHNLTILPTGDVLVTGGRTGPGDYNDGVVNPGVHEAQVWKPYAGTGGIGTWTTLASDPARRGYHSTAMLLPDGRVLSAGGEALGNNPHWKRPTIFCPPYLFAGNGLATRPTITASPPEVGYAKWFRITTPDWQSVSSVCLIRAGGVTHTFHQDQRYVPLAIVNRCDGQLVVQTPANANDAPPGYYLLFILKQGVPAIANWIKVSSPGPTSAANCNPGCPFVDVRTDQDWEVENSILGRSLSGELSVDTYHLKNWPASIDGRYRLRIREDEQEHTRLDEVRLVAVDHAPGTRAYALGSRLVLADRTSPYRVTTHTGRDVTSLVNGTGTDYFTGEPGETLLVELVDPRSARQSPSPPDLDPFEIDDGGKGGGNGLLAGSNLESLSGAMDAAVLTTTGMLVQGRDSQGVWRTVRQRHPREHFAESLVDTLDEGPVRLVFVGRHKLRFVGRVLPTGEATPTLQPLLVARHMRLGDVRPALLIPESVVTSLDPGDTLNLEFAATPVPAGLVRDFFLITRGVYSSSSMVAESRHESIGETLPGRFALLQSHPNPFTRTTTIGFELPRAAQVRIDVFDLQGRLVRRLISESYLAGRWSVEWDRTDNSGHPVSPAVYTYRMVADRFRDQMKMTLLP